MQSGADALPLPDARPGGLDHAGVELTNVGLRIDQTLLAKEGSAAEQALEAFPSGLSSAAITAELDVLSGHVGTASQNMSSAGSAMLDVKEAVDTARTTIEGLQEEWDDANTAYDRGVVLIDADIADGTLSDQESVDARHRSLSDTWYSVTEGLTGSWTRALDTLAEAVDGAANRLDGLTDAFVPPEHRGSVSDIAAHITDGAPISDTARVEEEHDIAVAEADEQVEEAAELIDRANDESLTPEERQAAMDEFVATYGHLAEDPYFSAALIDRVGPEPLLQSTVDLIELDEHAQGDPSLNDSIDAYMNVLGSVFVTSTNDSSDDHLSDHAQAELESERRVRRNEVIAAADRGGYDERSTEDGDPFSGWWAVSQLINGAQFADTPVLPDRSFTESVGAAMLSHFHEHGRDVHMTGDNRNPYQPYLLGLGYSDGLVHIPEDLEVPGDVSTGRMLGDPVYALQHAALQDDDAAAGLFLSDIGTRDVGGSAVPVSGLEYLMHRSYGLPMDMQEAVLTPLAEKVAQIGVDPYDEESTQIALEFVDAHLRLLPHEGTNHLPPSVDPDALAAIRTEVADVWAAHVDSLALAVQSGGIAPGADGVVPGNQVGYPEHVFHLSDEARMYLPDMFADLAEDRPDQYVWGPDTGDPDDPPALQRVINAILADSQIDIQGVMTSDEYGSMSAAETDIQQIADRSSLLLSYLNESVQAQGAADAAAQEAAGSYIADLVTAGATTGFGAIPGVGPGVKFVYAQTADPILDALINGWFEHPFDPSSGAITATQLDAGLREIMYQGVYAGEPWEVDPWDETTGSGVMSPEQWADQEDRRVPFHTTDPADWDLAQRQSFLDYMADTDGGAGGLTTDGAGEIGDNHVVARNLVETHKASQP